MQTNDHTAALVAAAKRASNLALLTAVAGTTLFMVGASLIGDRLMATNVIDYTAADGAPTETYTDSGSVGMAGGGAWVKLTGTEDGESATWWFIPTDRVEEINP